MIDSNITPCTDNELNWIDAHMEAFNRKSFHTLEALHQSDFMGIYNND